MFNFDYIAKEDIKEHKPKWPEIPDRPYGILIIGDSGSGKTNVLLNLKNQEPYIDKTYLYAKDPYKANYQLLINKTESTGLKYLNGLKALWNIQMIQMIFIKMLKNTTQIKNMIPDMLRNEKPNPMVTIIYQKKKIEYFSCFYYTILVRCSKSYQTKLNTLFCYENSKQKQSSTNRI